MAAGYAALFSLLLTVLSLTSYHYSGRERATSSGSRVERNLTLYAMAVGQGDGNIIFCPNGRDVLIVDMGANNARYTNFSYGAFLLKKFKVVKNKMRIHIVISHPDEDHYNFLPKSIDNELLDQVEEIVVGGVFENFNDTFMDWVEENNIKSRVYTINNSLECFGNSECKLTPVKKEVGTDSVYGFNMYRRHIAEMSANTRRDPWQFCGSDVDITVLGANICVPKKNNPGKCMYDTKNARSVVMKLTYKKWSVFLSGDFEGVHQQDRLIDRWSHDPSVLRSTYYKVAHHGAWTDKKANSKELLNAIRPRSAYISQAHPIETYCKYPHPKCEVIENLLAVGSIGKADTSPTDSSIICYQSQSKTFGNLKKCGGFAIYETCRKYDTTSDRQVCNDIRITSNGFDDHTEYVDVNPSQINNNPSKSTSKKKWCTKGREELKRHLSKLTCFK